MQVSEIAFPPTAPGCFAAPSVFSHDSQICRACSAFESCAAECVTTLKAICDKINVDDILARHARAVASTSTAAEPTISTKPKPDFTKFLPSVRKPQEKVERKVSREPVAAILKPDDTTIIGSISQAKGRALATTWCKRGLMPFIQTELQAGRNPFASQPRRTHESVVCEELLNGAVTTSSLKKAFMSRLGNKEPWGESTASSHVGIAIPALIAFGIVEETSQGWVLSPEPRCDNVSVPEQGET